MSWRRNAQADKNPCRNRAVLIIWRKYCAKSVHFTTKKDGTIFRFRPSLRPKQHEKHNEYSTFPKQTMHDTAYRCAFVHHSERKTVQKRCSMGEINWAAKRKACKHCLGFGYTVSKLRHASGRGPAQAVLCEQCQPRSPEEIAEAVEQEKTA